MTITIFNLHSRATYPFTKFNFLILILIGFNGIDSHNMGFGVDIGLNKIFCLEVFGFKIEFQVAHLSILTIAILQYLENCNICNKRKTFFMRYLPTFVTSTATPSSGIKASFSVAARFSRFV